MNDTHTLPVREADDFSIVLGGPLYQLYRKAHLVGTDLELLKRRLISIILVAWAPLVVLSILGSRALHHTVLPFLYDIEVHARCLVAIPLLILAEMVVHKRLRGIVRQFMDRRLIAPEDLPRFEEINVRARRLRNSVVAEVVQLGLAFAIHGLWGAAALLHTESWIATSDGGSWHFTWAGSWYAFVTLPVFRFLIFRWYFRIFIWYRFLWQVSRLPLRLDALHPDRAAGLGFLAGSPSIFTALFLAHSVFVAAMIQNKIWATGAKLIEFRFEIGGVIAFLAVLALTPLFFFSAKLALAKRRGNAEYGALASRYVAEFRNKWMTGPQSSDETLVGSGDIQSLADLSGAYDAIREMRFVPMTRQSIVQLLAIAALPFAPLALNLMPWDELLKRALGFLF